MRLPLSILHLLLLTVLLPHMIVAKSSAPLSKQTFVTSSSTSSSPALSSASHIYKTGKPFTLSRRAQQKQQQQQQQHQQQHLVQPKTLVVQIRSDHPVPLMFKGRPNLSSANTHHGLTQANTPNAYSKRQNYFISTPNHLLGNSHNHVHHHINGAASQLKTSRPIKPSGPVTLKNSIYTPFLYKPLKLKLTSSKGKLKGGSQTLQYRPTTNYDIPFKYETTNAATYITSNNAAKIPIESHPLFIADHFAPIYTVPAPNLALQDNHLSQTDAHTLTSTLKPQTYHQQHETHYEVDEEQTNDQIVSDPLSGSHKYYAPDPDPSLPTVHLRPSEEHFNQPSNNKPLPPDVQVSANQLTASAHAQPLVQYFNVEPTSGQNFIPQITQQVYPVQYSQQYIHPYSQHTQPDPTLVAAAVPIYNPTYLVTKSNNLYNQYKQQQLFKPSTLLSNDYVNADLTQEVASDGQILQSAKDPHNHQNVQFAALIAAPVLDQQQSLETISYRLPNVAAIKHHNTAGNGHYFESPYYANIESDSSQLLQAYAEEEAEQQQQHELQRQQQDERALHEHKQQQQRKQEQQQQLQKQYQQQLQQEHDKQNNYHLLFEQQQSHPRPHSQHQAQHQEQQEQQQKYHYQYHPEIHYQHHQEQNSALKAFEEHERLVKQQLGQDTPLRIYVPDENDIRLKKRSDDAHVKGFVNDVHNHKADNTDNVNNMDKNHNHEDNGNEQNDLFEVTSSIDVSNTDTQRDEQTRSTLE